MGMRPWEGHERGYEKVKELLKWCEELNIKALTIYALSLENLRRPEEELKILLKLIERGLLELALSEEVRDKGVRVKVIGKLELLPPSVREKAKLAEELTKENSKRYLLIALAYGGRQEIIDAMKKVVEDVVEGSLQLSSIRREEIEKRLYTGGLSSPDLVIRTSGEERLSGFLLWQASSSYLHFCDVYWPNFRKIDFLRAIREWQDARRSLEESWVGN